VDLVHGLPEEEGAEGHREVGRHPHHLRLALRSLAPADLDSATAACGDGRDEASNRTRPSALRDQIMGLGLTGLIWA
jgi:hypothetical protein